MSTPFDFDICVIGGGIIGAAVARDAAGRGLRVYLAERGDFAGGTSSASSKLIHGGLRYLETYEFRMVREGLLERAILRNMAPHLVSPLTFLVPLTENASRPAWMVRLGLWLYDFLAGSKRFAKSGAVSRQDVAQIPGLRPGKFTSVLHYTDGWGDDSRLTVDLIRDAARRGADVGNYRTVEKIVPCTDGYRVWVNGEEFTARILINAAGPYANHVLDLVEGGVDKPNRLRWVRGSHIVVPMPEGVTITHALTVQRPDKRVVFVLPWLEKYLIVGTTDVEQRQDEPITCSAAERAYLLEAYNEYCAPSRSDNEIVYAWAGVRPLVDDGAENASKVSRDFTFATHRQGSGGILTIYGGKLTVHRLIAEQAMHKVAADFGMAIGADWTASSTLPDWRLERAQSNSKHTDFFREIVPGVTRGDIDYAVRQDYVRTADDFLFRRTKLGIGMSEYERNIVAQEINRIQSGESHVTSAVA